MDKIRNFINFTLKRRFFGREVSNVSILSSLSAIFEFIMPLLLGVSVGWLGTVFVDFYLAPMSAELQLSRAVNIAASQSNVNSDNGLSDFLSANPFAISPFPVAASAATEQRTEVKVEDKNSFERATLTGTFPDIGAWMQDNTNNNEVSFIPLGEDFDVYKLTEVLYDRAVFRDEESNDVTKYLYLVTEIIPAPAAAKASPAPQTAAPQPALAQVSAPGTDGQEGVVARELINNLLMNPFDEMKKFRIRPKFDGEQSIGLEVQWLANDGILGQLGVVKNDVIQSINGIPLKNMGDITNAINSLMNSSRFDVEVMRGSAKTNLSYVVK